MKKRKREGRFCRENGREIAMGERIATSSKHKIPCYIFRKAENSTGILASPLPKKPALFGDP